MEKQSLYFTQRIEKKLAEYNASNSFLKRWLFEILSCLISALCMIAIMVIYIFLKDQPISKAGNLLTYTNILGKISSATLIVPISEALGQLKWNWFHNSRAMWDFEIFDKASRGPLGAILLLFRTKGRSLAAMGAVLILLLLAIDTFFQQVVNLPERWVLQGKGSIPRVIRYEPEYVPEYTLGYENQQFDVFIYPYIRPYLYGNGSSPVPYGNGSRPDIPLTCPTGTCEWPEYETLGVCSDCRDAADLLRYDCRYTSIDWTTNQTGKVGPGLSPNGTVCGYFFDSGKHGQFLMSGYIVNDTGSAKSYGEALLVRLLPYTELLMKNSMYTGSEKFQDVRNPLIHALIVSSPDAESVYNGLPPVAQECVLSWCVKTVQSKYDSGMYSEEVISTYRNNTPGPFPWIGYNATVGDSPGWWIEYGENATIRRLVSELRPSPAVVVDEAYGADNVSITNILSMFDNIFPSYITDNGPSGKKQMRFKDWWPGAFFREMPWSPWQAPNNVTQHLERLATAMTNGIRSSTTSANNLEGDAYGKETFVSVKWAWLAFPFTLLIFSIIFLAATIVKTSKDGTMGVWKNSAMPTLFYSFPEETQRQFTSTDSWKGGTVGVPKKTRIRIIPEKGWRVSGQNYLDGPQNPGFGARKHCGCE